MRTHKPDLSLQVSGTWLSPGVVVFGILLACFIAGFSLIWIPWWVVIGLTIMGVFAAICVRWPYAGLLIYLCMEYLRPTERYPVLSPLHLTRIVAVFVLIGWLVRRRRDGFELWVRAPENVAVIGMLAVIMLSIPFAYWKARAFDTSIDFVRTTIIFILISNIINTTKRLKGYIITFIILNVLLSAEQLFNYVAHGPTPEGLLRVGSASGSFLGEDGDFALAMGVALPYVYFLAWSNIKPVLRALSAAAGTMFVGSIVATGSRGGALGLVAVLFTLAVRSRSRRTAFALIGLILLFAWVMAPPAYKARVATITESHSQDLTAQSRLASWRAARQMFKDHPVLGVGAGNFLVAFIGRYGGSWSWSRTTHNVFYQAASELGICGLIVFFFLLACVLFRSVKLNYRLIRVGLGGSPMAAYVAALLPSTIAFLVSGSFQTPLYYPHIYYIAALALALNNIATPMLVERERKEIQPEWKPRQIRRRFSTVSK